MERRSADSWRGSIADLETCHAITGDALLEMFYLRRSLAAQGNKEDVDRLEVIIASTKTGLAALEQAIEHVKAGLGITQVSDPEV